MDMLVQAQGQRLGQERGPQWEYLDRTAARCRKKAEDSLLTYWGGHREGANLFLFFGIALISSLGMRKFPPSLLLPFLVYSQLIPASTFLFVF